MKNIILIVLTLTVNLSFGQTEKTANKVVTEKFIEHFNNDNYKIFYVFSQYSWVVERKIRCVVKPCKVQRW